MGGWGGLDVTGVGYRDGGMGGGGGVGGGGWGGGWGGCKV